MLSKADRRRVNKVVLFTNVRDEQNMYEWVAHHLLLGFDAIYIYDHKSMIPLEGQFDNFNKNGEKVFVTRCELDGGIKDLLITKAAECARIINADWMLYLDADEFFVINYDKINNVKEILKLYPHADSVSFNWLCFGTNYQIKQPKGLIIDNFTKSQLTLNNSLKTFIRPNEFLSPNAHRSEVKNINNAYHGNGTCFNVDQHPHLMNRHYTNEKKYYETLAYIAHYYVQSEEVYMKRKINTPRDDWGTNRDVNLTFFGKKITNDFTIHSECNDVENISVKNKYSENIKRYLESISLLDKITDNKPDIKIFGVYFICCINNYLDIVKEQLAILNKGLINITTKVLVFVTNYNKENCLELDNILNCYDNFEIITSEHNLYEKYAINNYKNFIKEENYYLYYFHTKGLKKSDDPLFNVYKSRRQLLNYYTLEQYNINIELLQFYDAVGCSLQLYPKKHFSGNFWWSKSSYLQNLKNVNDNYLSPEMYVLSNDNCNFISLANDTNDILIENYNLPSENKIKGQLTKKMIVVEEHKKLINLC
jgi:hypothetical protein